MGGSPGELSIDYGMLAETATRVEGVLASLEASEVRWLPSGVEQTGDSFVSDALDAAETMLDLEFCLLKEHVATLVGRVRAIRGEFDRTDRQLSEGVDG